MSSKGGVQSYPFDDDGWYRFGRSQALSKQHLPKLIVAQTVPALRVCFDSEGAFAPNNVRVNAILPAVGTDLWFLLGVLNGPVADWMFRRIAKPKDGGWFEANKQFIAPLPVPIATEAQRHGIASHARALQLLHSGRRNLMERIARRLGTVAQRARPETWLFPDLQPSERGAKGRARYDLDLKARHDALTASLKPSAVLDATLTDGELRFLVDGVAVVDRVFVTPADGPFVLAQWKVLAATFPITDKADGKRLSKVLRTLASPDNPVVVEQVLAAVAAFGEREAEIEAKEAEMNAALFALYGLTNAEAALVRAG